MSGKLDIVIQQGADFSRVISIKDADDVAVDIRNDSFAGQIRKKHTSDTSSVAFSTGYIPGTDADNQIRITLTNTQTAALSAGEYVYDVEWTRSGKVIRLIEGKAIVTPEVTR